MVWKPLCLSCQNEWVCFDSNLRIWSNEVVKSAAVPSSHSAAQGAVFRGRHSSKQVIPTSLVIQHSVKAHKIQILQRAAIHECLWYSPEYICIISQWHFSYSRSRHIMDRSNACWHGEMPFENNILESVFSMSPWCHLQEDSAPKSPLRSSEKGDQTSWARSLQ